MHIQIGDPLSRAGQIIALKELLVGGFEEAVARRLVSSSLCRLVLASWQRYSPRRCLGEHEERHGDRVGALVRAGMRFLRRWNAS